MGRNERVQAGMKIPRFLARAQLSRSGTHHLRQRSRDGGRAIKAQACRRLRPRRWACSMSDGAQWGQSSSC